MKLVKLDEQVIGEKIGFNIYDRNGNILVGSGFKLDMRAYNRLKQMNIQTIYIEDDIKVMFEEIFPAKVKAEIYKLLYQEFERVKTKRSLNSVNIYKIVNLIANSIVVGENKLFIDNFGYTDDISKLVNHSVTTVVYAYTLGKARGYDSSKLKSLVTGALLHDIGRLIDNSKHLELGYKLLKEVNTFTPLETIITLQHHENVDGSGYPNKLNGEKIHEYSKIVAIADKFSRLLEQGKTITEAFEYVENLVNIRFDKDLFKLFKEQVYLYPSGLQVKLSSGDIGVVVQQNKGFPTRPLIVTPNNILNLLTQLNLQVVSIVL